MSQHDHRKHGNPEDLEAYVARLEDPARAEWQRPDELVAALGLRAGMAVAEVGAGPGYFSLRLARAVGERGHVFAVDVEPRLLTVLRDRVQSSGLRNVSPVLGLPDDPLLPCAGLDLVLAVNVFHHFQGAAAYLKRLSRTLKPGGRLAVVDFHARETPVGPPVEERVSREQFLKAASEAGFAVASESQALPHQYFVLLTVR